KGCRVVINNGIHGSIGWEQVRVAVRRVAIIGPGVPLSPETDDSHMNRRDSFIAIVSRAKRRDPVAYCAEEEWAVVIGAGRSPETISSHGDMPVEARRNPICGVCATPTGILHVDSNCGLVTSGAYLVQHLVEDLPVVICAVIRVRHDFAQGEI